MLLGIDLGTSNSSVASHRGGRSTLFRTPEGAETMPSVIHMDRRGNRTVGVRAYDQAILAPENVAQGFKRLMGTATPIHFAAADRDMLPEEASAELLRTLVGYALVEAGASNVDGAVVTVPAAFNQLQSEATREAAAQAGLDRVALLQEPVAAAMAAMAASDVRSGQFLVYDLGGGTFDLALVQAAGGTVNVVAHEGVNMLGGRDFDRMILDELVRPWLAANFQLQEGHENDRRFERLTRVARLAAERAKMELSTRHETVISASDDLVRLEDSRGEPIYLDVPITRARLDGLVEAAVSRTIALSRQIVEDAGYALSDIDRVVLIGGPTKMPVIRARIAAELGIPVEDPGRVDPMTAVAVGAAIYCESRDWSGPVSIAKPSRTVAAASVAVNEAVAVSYDHDLRTAGTEARLRMTRTAGPEGMAVQVESALGWSSGRLSLDAPVELRLPLADPGPNQFRALVFDPLGRPVPDAGREFTVERTAAASAGIPATQSMGVKVQQDNGRNTLALLVAKGAVLPQHGTARFRAATTVRAGSPALLRLELFEISDPALLDPALNLHVGEFRIRGADLSDSMAVRRGDEVFVHWVMGESQTLQAEVEVPTLGQTFDDANFYDWQAGRQSFDGEEGGKLADDVLDRAEEDLDQAEKVLPLHARATLVPLRGRMDSARATLRTSLGAGTGAVTDADTRRAAAEEARLIRQAVATACAMPEARGAVLRRELNEQVRFWDRDVRAGAPEAANVRADQLARNARLEIEPGTEDGFAMAESLTDQLNALFWSEGLRQPGFCAKYWRWVRVERHLMRDKDRFDTVLAEGDAQLAAGDIASLRDSLRAMWNNKVSSGRGRDVGARADLLQQ